MAQSAEQSSRIGRYLKRVVDGHERVFVYLDLVDVLLGGHTLFEFLLGYLGFLSGCH